MANTLDKALKHWQETRLSLATYRTLNEDLNRLLLDLSPTDYKLYMECIGGGETNEAGQTSHVEGTSG